jgi:hypothetical protein
MGVLEGVLIVGELLLGALGFLLWQHIVDAKAAASAAHQHATNAHLAVGDHRLYAAQTYATTSEVEKLGDRLEAKLDRVLEQLQRKADKE